MSKIILDVNSKDVDTVLMILSNLKSGLISNISTDKKNTSTSIKNKNNFKKTVVQDEFMEKPSSTGKYLSRNAYKQKISR